MPHWLQPGTYTTDPTPESTGTPLAIVEYLIVARGNYLFGIICARTHIHVYYLKCFQDPPQDVAHLQFKSRIAFKLVWCPPNFDKFVLVDDDGELVRN